MANPLEGYETKDSVVVVYTGEGKGKTSASIGLTVRALGADWKVAYIQFIKHWNVSEHTFFEKIADVFTDKFFFFKGGQGFYNAGELSAKDVTESEHKQAAEETYAIALEKASSGDYQLVVCDEINNAVNDGLLTKQHLIDFIEKRHPKTSICLTGRDFPEELIERADIATNMTKLKHHFDDKFLANKGIDF